MFINLRNKKEKNAEKNLNHFCPPSCILSPVRCIQSREGGHKVHVPRAKYALRQVFAFMNIFYELHVVPQPFNSCTCNRD